MTEKKSRTKAPKTSEAPTEKPVKRRKPDALARAQAEVDGRDAKKAFAEAVAAKVEPAGLMVELPGAPEPRPLVMADLSLRDRRALAYYACDAEQLALLAPDEPEVKVLRGPKGSNAIALRGLITKARDVAKRQITELGARVARSGGITVTRPIAQDAAPVKAAS